MAEAGTPVGEWVTWGPEAVMLSHVGDDSENPAHTWSGCAAARWRPQDGSRMRDCATSWPWTRRPPANEAPDPVENPPVPAVVAEVVAEEQSAQDLVRELSRSLFSPGARTYAGPTLETCDGGEWDILRPFFVVVLVGRRLAYEGEWLLAELVIGDEDGPRGLHERLVRAVRAWEAGA